MRLLWICSVAIWIPPKTLRLLQVSCLLPEKSQMPKTWIKKTKKTNTIMINNHHCYELMNAVTIITPSQCMCWNFRAILRTSAWVFRFKWQLCDDLHYLNRVCNMYKQGYTLFPDPSSLATQLQGHRAHIKQLWLQQFCSNTCTCRYQTWYSRSGYDWTFYW